MKCRHCHSTVDHRFLDLGTSPPSNAYLTQEALAAPEVYFPLRVLVCTNCWLVQTEDFTRAEQLFNDEYAYFSSVSESWLRHAELYSHAITKRLGLSDKSLVMELASNDGYLLKNFVSAGIPCLGIEPTESTALVAEAAGIRVIKKFFSSELARELVEQSLQSDLIVGNNVYAHVPDINDFTRGIKIALRSRGVVTLEFPHVMRLIQHAQFDTVYHEHFSYLSLTTVKRVFAEAGLRVWDVDELSTHGGSLRIYGCHANDPRPEEAAVSRICAAEREAGLLDESIYTSFQIRAERIKDEIVSFLIDQKRLGKRVAGYGAAAKGNTLLNFAGIKADLLPYVCDAADSKQGKYLPGSRIPILSPEVLRERKPDFVVIMPWNIQAEVTKLHSYVRSWGGKFVVAIPRLNVLS